MSQKNHISGHDKLVDLIYEAVNLPALSRVPKAAKCLLDLGCGSGSLGRRIKEEIGCNVTGVTNSELEATLASKYLDEVLVCDLNGFDPGEVGQFDCIVCSHVLEHLYQPAQLLKRISKSLSHGGTLIVVLPNVLHWRQRLEFLMGRFRYTIGGLMDHTHYRFYDWDTARMLLADSGYIVLERKAYGSFPLSRFLFKFGSWLDRAALTTYPGLFGFQFVFVCRPVQFEP